MEYEEIRKATSNFREDSRLRGGGPRDRYSVYKGWIDENYVAAVKPGSGIAVAVTVRHDEGQGMAYWLEKRINLSQYRHPNLVIPIGYVSDRGTDTRIFVNEFMARGSLDRHLFIEKKPLPWATRMRVAVGAARGLAFLHNLEVPVLYGVLKTGDILLDADFNAKLSDFGIERDGYIPSEIEAAPWAISARYGRHAAPEIINDEVPSTKCDVYSFGVVLLELMSGLLGGKQPEEWHNLIMDLDNLIMDLDNLIMKRRLSRIMDGRLEGEYLHKEAYKVALIARQCVSQFRGSRPTMAEVVAALEKP